MAQKSPILSGGAKPHLNRTPTYVTRIPKQFYFRQRVLTEVSSRTKLVEGAEN